MREDNEIPKGWVESSLGEIALINPRESITKGAIAKSIPMASLEPFTKKIQSFEIKEFNGGTKFRNGDTLLARITPCLENGKTAFVDILKENEVGFGSTEYIVIRSKRQCSDKNFLYYLSISPLFREVAKKVMTGTSGRQRVQTDVLINRKFNLPPLPEQKAIASILTSFDDKIELLQAQNEILETIAQTIFKEWFGKYQVGDELPEGWRVGKLGELTNKISKGTTPRNIDIEGLEVKIPFLKVKDISNEGLISKNDLELIPKQVHEKQLKRSILETNDILFSIAGTIGRVAIVDKELDHANCNQALAFIRLKNKNKFKEYVHLWLKSREIQNEINSSIVQGVQANVSLAVLGNLKITIPNDSQMNIWKELIYPIYSKLDNNSTQIQTLQATRDTLLPKLMSGQLRVAEFQEQLSEVM